MRSATLILAAVMLMAAPAAHGQLSADWMVAAAANTPGVGGTYWRTDLSLHNPHEFDLPVVLQFLPSDTDNWEADWMVIELYPFGRTIFGFELLPLLKEIQIGAFGSVKTVCSLRDVLVEKRDPVEYEQRVLNGLNKYFNLLLIHSDAEIISLENSFSRAAQINIPVHYTGFVSQCVAGTGRKSIRTAWRRPVSRYCA